MKYDEEVEAPIDMLLWCPVCHHQHVDRTEAGWANPPHKSHKCARCGCIWRPCDRPTNGVEYIKTFGKDDTYRRGTLPDDPPIGRKIDRGATRYKLGPKT
jgi:hypothetical protein